MPRTLPGSAIFARHLAPAQADYAWPVRGKRRARTNPDKSVVRRPARAPNAGREAGAWIHAWRVRGLPGSRHGLSRLWPGGHSHYRLVMLSRWLGGLSAGAAALVACVLVILDLTDAGVQRWWEAHALTTDTIAGLLVLLITILVVDQVVRLRQRNSQARAVAVQVAILMTQANRASQAVSRVLAGSGDPDRAREDFRTYTMMLLAVAPLLIEAKTSRNFLERAQHLAGEMAWALNWLPTAPGQENSSPTRLDDTVQALKSASTPLLQNLRPEMRELADRLGLEVARSGDDPT
jgi:hypothetical protein